MMRIAIFGTGGAGGYFGARLAQVGEDVTFIARGQHLQAIREHGLRIERDKGDIVIQPAQATDDPASVGIVDVIIVGVKAWQVIDAARSMQSMIGSNTMIVPLQNGVEAASQLSGMIGAQYVVGGLCSTVSYIAGPGRIRNIGDVNYIKFGEVDQRPSDRTEQLRQTFQRANVPVEIPADIRVALWEKFLFVVSFGGLGAVTRMPIGVLRTLPETRQMLKQCMREILAVGRAHQVTLADEVIDKTMQSIDSFAPASTASMQRDIIDGKPSELEAWNGAVVRLGRQVQVPTPLHTFIYHCLLPLELRARGTLPA